MMVHAAIEDHESCSTRSLDRAYPSHIESRRTGEKSSWLNHKSGAAQPRIRLCLAHKSLGAGAQDFQIKLLFMREIRNSETPAQIDGCNRLACDTSQPFRNLNSVLP